MKVLRQYLSPIAAAVALLLIAVLVSPMDPAGSELTTGPGAVTVDPATGQVIAVGGTPGSAPAPTGGTSAAGDGSGSASGSRDAPPVVGPCATRAEQVPGDPYSPPCIEFAGDNGGATSRGVTAEAITVSVRQLDLGSASQAFARLGGDIVQEDPQLIYDTLQAYVDYFNQAFQFYGRRIELHYYQGRGSLLDELLGGGRELALADATTAADQVQSFAELNGLTLPYADALAQKGVISFGAPYPSSEWHVDRRPYVWSYFPDGTRVIGAVADWMRARIGAGSTVQYAGPALNGRPRRIAIVSPENPEYRQSVDAFLARMQEFGIPVDLDIRYQLDLGTMPNQASSIVAQLKDAGITTVITGTDPIMLAIGLLAKAKEQGYEPEWITAGLAFVDQDIVGHLFEPSQWQHAFGIAFNAQVQPRTRSFAYAAYKRVRPDAEPSLLFEQLYYQVYLLAIGIQMAGPNLTPATYEAGMFAYPPHSGPMGRWHFGPGDYTSTDDFREIWWDPTVVSPQDNKPGAWQELNGGARYTTDAPPPTGPAPYFQ